MLSGEVSMSERARRALQLWSVAVLSLLSLSAAGCGVDLVYLLPAAVGQIDLLLHAEPISGAIAGGGLSDEQVAKLELVQETRAYAHDVMGLNVSNNYTTFYDSGGRPVVYNVSASRRDAFVPKVWRFPFVGTVPYLGYFDLAAARTKADALRAQGYDVFVYEVDAYSGLGFLPNPVLSPMLERSETSLAETVFHELLHGTVWRPNDTSFNESLATFYGRTGAMEFLAFRYPDEPDRVEEARQSFEDVDRYNAFALELFNELDAFYSSDLSSAEKIEGREAIYQAGRDRFMAEIHPLLNDPSRYDWVADMPTNNAFMLGIRRYNLDLTVFEEVFERTDGDWLVCLPIFQAAADSSAGPYTYLRDWLESQSE
jgi:predicted aminopeptidase